MSDDLVKRLRDRRVCSLAQNSCRNDWACEEAADRIEELEVLYEAAVNDAKEAEAYAEEVEAGRKKTYKALLKMSRIHGEVEEKLAKAMQVVEMIASADVDAVLGQAVDLSCEIIGELMEDE